MKLRKTPPTEGLVGIAMHVLLCIFIFFGVGAGSAKERDESGDSSAAVIEVHHLPITEWIIASRINALECLPRDIQPGSLLLADNGAIPMESGNSFIHVNSPRLSAGNLTTLTLFDVDRHTNGHGSKVVSRNLAAIPLDVKTCDETAHSATDYASDETAQPNISTNGGEDHMEWWEGILLMIVTGVGGIIGVWIGYYCAVGWKEGRSSWP